MNGQARTNLEHLATSQTFNACARTFKTYRAIREPDIHQSIQAVRALQESLIEMGRQRGNARFSEKGTLLKFEPDGFERDIRLLSKFAKKMTYSPALMDWMNRSRIIFAAKLRETKPPHSLFQEWCAADSTSGRLKVVEDVLATHADIFSEQGNLNFPHPRVVVIASEDALKKDIYGCVGADFGQLKQGIMPEIELAPHLLDDTAGSFSRGYKIWYHEQLHWLLSYLALAYVLEKIDEAHPLFEDAKMQAEKLEHDAIIDSAIFDAYMAQREEQLCYDQSDKFDYAYVFNDLELAVD
jgi:hypothetical protein